MTTVIVGSSAAKFRSIWAAGDVARFWHSLFGVAMRTERWTNADEQVGIGATAE